MELAAASPTRILRRPWDAARAAAWLGSAAGIALFILFPLFRVLEVTFWEHDHLTLGILRRVLEFSYNRRALTNSLLLAALVSITGTLTGFLFAYTTTRPRLARWGRVLNYLIVLPLISPPFLVAIALLFSFGRNGIFWRLIPPLQQVETYGLPITFLAETLTYFPVAFLTLRGILHGMDPNLEQAALSLGGSRWRVFRTVTVPLAAPGIVNSVLLLFGTSLADFATPLILAGSRFPVLPVQAYLQVTGSYDLQAGAALSFLLIVPALAVFVLQRAWLGSRRFVTVTGQGSQRSPARATSRRADVVLLGLCLLISAFVLYLYGMILYGSLVRLWGVDGTFTLAHYRYALTTDWRGVRDTLIIAGLATPVGAVLAVVLATLVARRRAAGAALLEFAAMLNYALPGTVVGIGYLLAFNTRPLQLTGTAIILALSFVFRYNPVGIRVMIASLLQVDPALEEASQNLGAGSVRTFRKVTLPLVAPAVLAGLEYLWVRSLTSISAAIFLVSVNWTLITVEILQHATELALGQAAALSVLLMLSVFGGIAVLRSLVGLIPAQRG
jgi:iron(III) transport system permease protein